MRGFSSLGGIGALVAAAFLCSPSFAEPDLFIDGNQLADNVTPTLLADKTSPTLKASVSPLNLLRDLYQGSTYYMKVDREAKSHLRGWLLSQNFRSVEPHTFYAKAIEICGNDVQKGLITAWSVLREDWDNHRRNEYPHIQKLVDITGELEHFQGQEVSVIHRGKPQKTKSIRGDNFSAWYHMTGTALLAYTLAASNLPLPKAITGAMIELEERVYHDEFIDPFKRRYIDYQGVHFGVRLARNLRQFRDSESFLAARKPVPYLNQEPSKMPGNWPLLPGETSADYYRRNPRSFCYMQYKQLIAHTVLGVPGVAVGGAAAGATALWYLLKAIDRTISEPDMVR